MKAPAVGGVEAGLLAQLAPASDPVTAVEQRLSEVLPLTEETRSEAAIYYAYLARSRSSARLREVADAVDEALAGMFPR